MTMFDLPVEEPGQVRRYNRFRRRLLSFGYACFQKSVYVKYCASDEYARTIRRLEGRVNSFAFTDAEFERQDFFLDGKRTVPPAKPSQMEFF